MWEAYDDHSSYGDHAHMGLGAVLAVQAGTYDGNDQPKTVFAPGESIYFRATGEPNTGVLVQFWKDNVEQQPLGWDGVMTDSSGLAQWRATAGPSGIGNGSFRYKVVIPVMGVAPDPSSTIAFTVGAGATSTTTTTTTTGGRTGSTGTTPTSDGSARSTPVYTSPTPMQCPSGYYYDALAQTCLHIQPLTNVQTNANVTNTGVETFNDPCAAYGLQSANDGTGRCIIPRTTTERYGTNPSPEQQAAQQAQQDRSIREAVAAQAALDAARAAQATASTIADLERRLAAAEAAARATGALQTDLLTGNNTPASSTTTLPDYLQGTWFGLPKPLVIGGAVLLAFMFKK